MKIDLDRIAQAARDADREVEIHGLPHWASSHQVDLHGLTYMAEQRALRSAMALDGQDPTVRTTREVHLSSVVQALMPALSAVWIDGFAAGLNAKEKPDG